jgi:carboxyl-terminal processing protease
MLRRTLGARTWASLAWLLGPLVMTAPRASSEPAAQAQPNLLAAPTPTPVPAARIPVAQPDEVPRLITGVRPQYPPEYAGKQVEGRILVDFIVRTDGTVTRVHAISSPDPRLSVFAEAAVSQWRFSSGLKNGVPVNTHMQVPVVFKAVPPKGPPGAEAGLDPDASNSARHLAQGNADMEKRDYGAAALEFDAAVRLEPDSGAGYVGRAQAYALQGRQDEALEDFIQAALLEPADQASLEAYQKTLPDSPERRWKSLRYQTFTMVWRTVNETYFDRTFGGVDWLAVREKYRTRLATAAENAQLIGLLQQMLAELRRTHFSIVPRDAAVFNPSERVRIGTTGAEVAFVEGGVVVTEVRQGSTGAAAGIRPGDLITQVDATATAPNLALLAKAGLTPARSGLYMTQFIESRLAAAVGTKVQLDLVAPEAGAAPRHVTVECGANDAQWSEPVGYFPSMPISCEARRDPDGVAYLRFNIFVPPVMKDVRSLLRLLAPGDGLIVDLRGNMGGIATMASGICGWLCRDEFVLGSMHKRDGVASLDVYPQTGIFDGPVAILIDGRSASTSEILAAGLKDKRRARLFGELSAGAALPSVFERLPTGDLFQFAIADVTTPSGALLEGNGVAPDEAVLRSRVDLAAGRDPVVEAARKWIDAERRKKGGEPERPSAKGR